MSRLAACIKRAKIAKSSVASIYLRAKDPIEVSKLAIGSSKPAQKNNISVTNASRPPQFAPVSSSQTLRQEGSTPTPTVVNKSDNITQSSQVSSAPKPTGSAQVASTPILSVEAPAPPKILPVLEEEETDPEALAAARYAAERYANRKNAAAKPKTNIAAWTEESLF